MIFAFVERTLDISEINFSYKQIVVRTKQKITNLVKSLEYLEVGRYYIMLLY